MSDVTFFVALCGFVGMLFTLATGLVQRLVLHRRWKLERFREETARTERLVASVAQRVDAMDAATRFSPGGITGPISSMERYDGRPPSLVSELDAWQEEYDRACQMHEARVALRGLGPT